MEVISTF